MLGAHVFDSDRVAFWTAIGDVAGPVIRLHDGQDEHLRQARPGPNGREVEGVVGQLLGWSAAAAYRPPADVAALARRAVGVWAAYTLACGKLDKSREDRELVETWLAKGLLGPEPEIGDDHDRKWADRRATWLACSDHESNDCR